MEKEVPYKTEEYYSQKIKESADHLFATLVNRVSAYDLARVRDAYNLASEAHSSQRRKTGEPYIIHPIAVARIIAEELELGANPVIAALLHDVVEDTDTTIDDIRNRFGDDVAFLVGVVTKQKKDKYDFSKQVDNFRQILASVQFDIRAILIKLADRLHNMRTLDSMRPDKQMKIAGETDYFYAPLANRLGLYHVKSELENLSFRYRCPREYAALDARLQKEKSEKSASIEEFCNKVQQLLMAQGINVRIEVRYRTLYSIWRKMQSAECDFQHIDDKHYTRIIYDTESIEQEKKMSLRIYSVRSGLVFGSFLAMWSCLAFKMAGAPFYAGSDVVGILGLCGIAGALTASFVGGSIRKVGIRRFNYIGFTLNLCAWALLYYGGNSYVGIVAGIILIDIGMQCVQLSNQASIFELCPSASNRVNTIFMTTYFIGGSLGTFLAGSCWEMWGWAGVALASVTLTLLAALLTLCTKK